jgi:hypothetical protein
VDPNRRPGGRQLGHGHGDTDGWVVFQGLKVSVFSVQVSAQPLAVKRSV